MTREFGQELQLEDKQVSQETLKTKIDQANITRLSSLYEAIKSHDD